ncbi:hypothetical protein C8R43DRAFT_955276 [Mycena crocata]|nr:hypothetical protein C8R43DRAFT_955276 [Mycena crocata]
MSENTVHYFHTILMMVRAALAPLAAALEEDCRFPPFLAGVRVIPGEILRILHLGFPRLSLSSSSQHRFAHTSGTNYPYHTTLTAPECPVPLAPVPVTILPTRSIPRSAHPHPYNNLSSPSEDEVKHILWVLGLLALLAVGGAMVAGIITVYIRRRDTAAAAAIPVIEERAWIDEVLALGNSYAAPAPGLPRLMAPMLELPSTPVFAPPTPCPQPAPLLPLLSTSRPRGSAPAGTPPRALAHFSPRRPRRPCAPKPQSQDPAVLVLHTPRHPRTPLAPSLSSPTSALRLRLELQERAARRGQVDLFPPSPPYAVTAPVTPSDTRAPLSNHPVAGSSRHAPPPASDQLHSQFETHEFDAWEPCRRTVEREQADQAYAERLWGMELEEREPLIDEEWNAQLEALDVPSNPAVIARYWEWGIATFAEHMAIHRHNHRTHRVEHSVVLASAPSSAINVEASGAEVEGDEEEAAGQENARPMSLKARGKQREWCSPFTSTAAFLMTLRENYSVWSSEIIVYTSYTKDPPLLHGVSRSYLPSWSPDFARILKPERIRYHYFKARLSIEVSIQKEREYMYMRDETRRTKTVRKERNRMECTRKEEEVNGQIVLDRGRQHNAPDVRRRGRGTRHTAPYVPRSRRGLVLMTPDAEVDNVAASQANRKELEEAIAGGNMKDRAMGWRIEGLKEDRKEDVVMERINDDVEA